MPANPCIERETVEEQRENLTFIGPSITVKKVLIASSPGSQKTSIAMLNAEPFLALGFAVYITTSTNSMVSFKKSITGRLFKQTFTIGPIPLRQGRPPPGYLAQSRNGERIFVTTHQGIFKIYNQEQPAVIIVDEVHKFTASVSKLYQQYEDLLRNKLHPSSRVILSSGSVMASKPVQMALILNLILNDSERFNIETFNETYIHGDIVGGEMILRAINKNDFMRRIKNRIAFYQGKSVAYPKVARTMVEVALKGKQRRMHERLTTEYLDIHSTAMLSGHLGPVKVWREKDSAEADLDEEKDNEGDDYENPSPTLINILRTSNALMNSQSGTHSYNIAAKMDYLNWLIKQPTFQFPCIIFSAYRSFGVEYVASMLRNEGYSELVYESGEVVTIKGRRDTSFLVLGGAGKKIDELVKATTETDIILVTTSTAIGFTVMNTRTEIFLEPNLNIGQTRQAEGRGVRFCSGVNRTVEVFYLYTNTYMDKIMELAIKSKRDISQQFGEMIWASALNCAKHREVNKETVRQIERDPEADVVCYNRDIPGDELRYQVPDNVEVIPKNFTEEQLTSMLQWIKHNIIYDYVRYVSLSGQKDACKRAANKMNTTMGIEDVVRVGNVVSGAGTITLHIE
jgi:hypothetical protein